MHHKRFLNDVYLFVPTPSTAQSANRCSVALDRKIHGPIKLVN
jgi:hypothetical protein